MNVNMKMRFLPIFFFLLFIFFLSIGLNNGFHFNCFNSNDLGIYGQAITKISKLQEFNPYLTIREVKLFNDHFDPILWPVTLLLNMTRSTSYFYLLDLFFFSITFFFLVFSLAKKNAFFILFFLISQKAIWYALLFPIHPTTWAMLPMLLLTISITKENQFSIFLSSLFLLSFREEFIFPIFALSFFYLLTKKLKLFSALFFTSLLWGFFVFKGRSFLWGETISYGSQLLTPFLHSPLSAIKDLLQKTNMAIFQLFFPFLFFLLKNSKDLFRSSHTLAFLFLFAPLLLIRFLSWQWGFHYSALFIPSFIYLLCKYDPPKRNFLLFFITTSFLFSLSQIKKASFLFSKEEKALSCSFSKIKEKETEEVLSLIKKRANNNEEIFATGGIVPQLQLIAPQLNHLLAPHSTKEEIDILILEINKSGDTWPMSYLDLKKTKEWLETLHLTTLYEGNYYFIVEGKLKMRDLREHLSSQP